MTKNKMFQKDGFKLGTFSSNCSSGMTVSKAPERWVNSWENNLKLGKMLDEAGMDFILPIARWIGYGGETDFHGSVLETVTWATALLANTKDISVFATIHTAANHPVVVAKQIATMDQIGAGRAGLNIVAGWNKPEYEALGLTLPDDHESRYGYADYRNPDYGYRDSGITDLCVGSGGGSGSAASSLHCWNMAMASS